jgi:hypothetical protein
LIKELSDALRTAVLDAANAAKDDHSSAVAGIEASTEWQQLDPADRTAILESSGLTAPAVPTVGTKEELLKALDHTPLTVWIERRQAIPAKVGAARAAAAKKLEPKSVAVTAPSATLRTEADVDAYVTELREQLIRHIADGETIII